MTTGAPSRSASVLHSSTPSAITTPPPEMMTGNFARGEQVGGFVQALLAAGAAVEPLRLRNLGLDLAVEIVARDVQLGRTHLGHRAVEAAAGEFGHARGVLTCPWYLVNSWNIGSWFGFLEAAEANAHRAGSQG